MSQSRRRRLTTCHEQPARAAGQEGHYIGKDSGRPHSGQKGNLYQGNPHSGWSKLKGAPHGIIKLPPSERLCATAPPLWYDAAMVTLLPIEPVNERHGGLIVEAFNRFFIDRGGQPDDAGDGVGYGSGRGDGRGDGYGYSWGDCRGDGRGDGYGYGYGNGDGKCPEAWQAE